MMALHLSIALIISTTTLVVASTGSFSQMFAAQNKAGFPSGMLVETTDMGDSQQVEKLLAQLESPVFQNAVKQAVLQHSADTSRALSEDWEDPLLCRYDWLSWLPWLDCILETPERMAPPLLHREEGECYREL